MIVSYYDHLGFRCFLRPSSNRLEYLYNARSFTLTDMYCFPLWERMKRFMKPLVQISLKRFEVVVLHKFSIDGEDIVTRLTMTVVPDRYGADRFLESFHVLRRQTALTPKKEVRLIGRVLAPVVKEAIKQNLSILDISRVPLESPIKSHPRHLELQRLLKQHGLFLLHDELVISMKE